MKILYIDVETGGLDVQKSALIQLSGIIEIDGDVKEKFNYFVKPFRNSVIEEKALSMQGLRMSSFADSKYRSEREVYKSFVGILNKYVDKYNKEDKFTIAGYNVNFDIGVLDSFFKRASDSYLFSYIKSAKIDPVNIIGLLQTMDLLQETQSNKLEDWCAYFGIELEAHNSESDIEATRLLVKKLEDIIKNKKEIVKEIVEEGVGEVKKNKKNNVRLLREKDYKIIKIWSYYGDLSIKLYNESYGGVEYYRKEEETGLYFRMSPIGEITSEDKYGLDEVVGTLMSIRG